MEVSVRTDCEQYSTSQMFRTVVTESHGDYKTQEVILDINPGSGQGPGEMRNRATPSFCGVVNRERTNLLKKKSKVDHIVITIVSTGDLSFRFLAEAAEVT